MVYFIGFILFGFLIGGAYIYYIYQTFKRNKSKVEFEINKNINNDEWINDYKKINKVPIKWYGVKLGDYKTEEAIVKYKKECRRLIVGKIFPSVFEVVSNNLIDFDSSDFDKTDSEFFTEKSKKFHGYEKKNKKIIKELFNNTKRKTYDKFVFDFDFTCKIGNKKINIIRFINMKSKGPGDTTSQPYYINSFIGYLIIILDFNDLNKLNELNKKDFYYNEKNKTLVLIVSDQINSKAVRRDLDLYYPEDYSNQENNDNMYFNLYHSFYIKLNEYIKRFV